MQIYDIVLLPLCIEYFRAHQKQIIVSSNNVFKETSMIDLESVNNIIKSVYETLDELDQSTD